MTQEQVIEKNFMEGIHSWELFRWKHKKVVEHEFC